ncbi:diguanylate cyclase (GGDEF)-like protein [Actinoplanes tereljensis]|uniref:putative bifunctional diguanylate cyclase/phosphodiesterase n=1 Tax=Paractinoplanes tereljensis TaxID=571912 RepID=UPI0019422725|nr:bifunctional diguanylate cyclase/phosphodiesterase [Actinoplanes tereljensis]
MRTARWIRAHGLLMIIGLAAMATVGVRIVTDPQGDDRSAEFFRSYLLTSILTTTFCWIAAFRGPAAARRPWRWIAIAFTAMLLPQPYSVVMAATHEGKLPLSGILAALTGRLAWAPLVLVGLLMFPMKSLTGRARTRFIADLTTVIGGGFVVSWYFQLGPALQNGRIGPDALIVIGFPVTDLALIFGVCALLMRNGLTSWRGPLPLFLAGLITYLAGDVTYAHLIGNGPMTWTTPLSVTLNGADLIMATAAAMQIMRPGEGTRPKDQEQSKIAYLPYVALLAGYVLLLVAAAREGNLYPWAGLAVGIIVMTGAVVLRQIVAMRENHGLVVRDHLTGLANRLSVAPALEAAVRRHRETGVASAVLVIDLNGFKKINDTLGHEAGDALLVTFAEVLRSAVRGVDVAARVGGDEFVVVLDRPGDADQALAVAQRILDRAAGSPTPIRAAIGVVLTDPETDVVTVRHRADMAMYAAKRAGLGRPELWHPGLESATGAADTFDAEILAATAAGQLRLAYQPIVTLATGEITGVEALVRWEHPERGTLLPDAFIAAAERTGAIDDLGLWVLETATRQTRHWQDEFGRRLYVSVNLSPYQLPSPGLTDAVLGTLAVTGLNPHDLVLELTESALVHESEGAAILEALRRADIRIAVDDFGTGYSSLRYLTRLPIDILKLDRCFVSELNGEPQGSAVAEAVIRLAQALHLDTVAEGIEVPAQATELTLLGYRSGQGYHYARPLSAEALTSVLRVSGGQPDGETVGMPVQDDVVAGLMGDPQA